MGTELSENLKMMRAKKGISQKELADYLQIDRTTYTKYESGDSSPDYEKLMKLADYFQVSVDRLLGRETVYSESDIQTIAAHHEGEDWSEEEREEIERFKAFVRMKRQQKG